MTTIRIQALKKQLQFLNSKASEVGYSGAYGAGKTVALCLKLALRACIPGAVEALVRKYNVTIKKTTLRTLLKGTGDVPPILPQGTYKHYLTEQRIQIIGGGEIMYFGLDDPDKIGSYECSGVAIDEAVELDESDYRQLRGRRRLQVEGLNRQIYWACNPGTPSHFIAERFGLAPGGSITEGCEVIETCSHDNTFLPADYLADLDTFTGIAKARFVDGRWVGSDGLVYDNWDRNTHVVERPASDFDRFLVGVDDGYTNPLVMLLYGVDGDDRLHCFREYYESRIKHETAIGWADEMGKSFDIENFIVDPSAARLIGLLQEAGHSVGRANNEVFDGIRRVQSRLAVAGDGLPRYTVDPGCKNHIREFETYEWAKDKGRDYHKDKPNKVDDHTMDAGRYVVSHVDTKSPLKIAVIGGDTDYNDEDNIHDERFWS